jgi:hypothetical protein
MASSSTIAYRTSRVPKANDWYYHLRQAIPSVRVMSRPEKPDLERPAFRTCSKGQLLRCLTYIHTLVVSYSF